MVSSLARSLFEMYRSIMIPAMVEGPQGVLVGDSCVSASSIYGRGLGLHAGPTNRSRVQMYLANRAPGIEASLLRGRMSALRIVASCARAFCFRLSTSAFVSGPFSVLGCCAVENLS